MGQQHTLVHRLADWAERQPDAPAIHEKEVDGSWRTYTWAEYWIAVRDTAKGLIALGHEVGDCVALVGGSRCGWVISQFAIQAARGVPAPIYTNNTVEQAAYIAQHARTKIAIADTTEQLGKYRAGIEQGLMSAEHLILMDEPADGDDRVMSLEQLQALGRGQGDAELEKRIREITTDETALLIYTSGTTGVPKGVQLSHLNMTSMTEGLLERFPAFRPETPDTAPFRIVSYLPLSHIAEQIATNFTQLATGGQAFFCSDMAQIKDYLSNSVSRRSARLGEVPGSTGEPLCRSVRTQRKAHELGTQHRARMLREGGCQRAALLVTRAHTRAEAGDLQDPRWARPG